jgi:hypothetical protein
MVLGRPTKIPVTIIVALIALITPAITAVLIPGVVDRFFYPVVELTMKEDNVPGSATMKAAEFVLTNYGSRTAENLTLSIKAPGKVLSLTNEFSTVPISLPQMNDTLLGVDRTANLTHLDSVFVKLQTDKFSPGLGSKVVIKLIIDVRVANPQYDASVVYDNGSAKMIEANAITFKGLVDNIIEPRNAAILGALIIIGAIFLYRYHHPLQRKLGKFAVDNRKRS